ncbi:MAG: hypothetical protein M0R51_17265 [Clostridia bacterium]|jgi:hypothetical protein|nr:hypothetical protein [Clostridia bacterium]
MLHTTKETQQGNTVYLEHDFKNLNGVSTDPDTTPSYDISNSAGTSVQSGSLNKRKNGYWYTYFVPADIGVYTITFTGEIGGETVLHKIDLRVVEKLLSE